MYSFYYYCTTYHSVLYTVYGRTDLYLYCVKRLDTYVYLLRDMEIPKVSISHFPNSWLGLDSE